MQQQTLLRPMSFPKGPIYSLKKDLFSKVVLEGSRQIEAEEHCNPPLRKEGKLNKRKD
jgi:hypothetical protein